MRIWIVSILVLLAIVSTAQKRKVILPDGHSLLVEKVKVDKQEKYLYTLEREKCIMWDLKTGHQLYTFRASGSEYGMGMDISPDGKFLAIAMDGPLYLFNTETGEQVGKTGGYDSFKDCVFSVDGKSIYAASDGIKILNVSNLTVQKTIKSSLTYKAKLELVRNDQVLLYNGSSFESYNISSGVPIISGKYNGNSYAKVTFLPAQQLIAGTSNSSSTDFYNINNGNLAGSIKVDAYDKAIIPSQNTNEILITGPTVKEGFLSLNVYSTETFRLTGTLANSESVKYHSTTSGYFNGRKKLAYLVNYNLIAEYDLAVKKVARTFTGLAADLGMDVFNPMEYNQATGRLHINTDDQYLKTIDLFRMVPVYHKDIGSLPTALSVSSTGDTVGIFTENKFVIKNFRNNRVIKSGAVSGSTGFLNRNAFFFSNDGGAMFYADETKENILLKKYNTVSGLSETVFSVKGFGPLNVHPDKTMMAGFESAYGLNVASVWNLQTKKRVFSRSMESDGEYDDQMAALSANKKQVMVVDGGKLGIYDIQSGNAVVENVNVGGIDKFGSSAASSDLSLFAEGDRMGNLTVYNNRGSKIWEQRAHNNTIRRILFSPDDKVMYTISYDHTVKVWQTGNGRFIGVLYLFRGSNDYVFMDEEGRFDGTPEGIKKIYSILNKNEVPLDKVFEKYYTPNLYARSVAGEKFPAIDVENIRPLPRVRISYAAVQRNLEVKDDKPVFQNTTGAAEITVNAMAPDDAIDEIRLFHNGKAVNLATRNLFVTDDKTSESQKKYVVSLLPGKNTFRAIALNSQRTESNPDEMDVIYKATTPGSNTVPVATGELSNVQRNATLYLLVVGINKYANPNMSLNYALADATSFRGELETGAKTIINTVKTFFVSDDNANHSGIIASFKEVQANAKPEDVFVFYYAGHGVIGTDKEFYLVPQDVSDLKNVQDELKQKGIASKLMQQYAVNIQAQKQLFVLDACQSAGAFATMLSNDGDQQKNIAVVARSTGTHWIAASGAQQFANEFSQLGHGAFTYVLLQALKGQAASNKMITVNGLKNYLQLNVPELMKKYNGTPQYPASYGFGNDFPVGILK